MPSTQSSQILACSFLAPSEPGSVTVAPDRFARGMLGEDAAAALLRCELRPVGILHAVSGQIEGRWVHAITLAVARGIEVDAAGWVERNLPETWAELPPRAFRAWVEAGKARTWH